MTWTIHRGYLNEPNGLPVADTLIFVKHKERSYEAVALYHGKSRNVFKKDKDKLFNLLSNPINFDKEKIKFFLYENPEFMEKIFSKTVKNQEIKGFLEKKLEENS